MLPIEFPSHDTMPSINFCFQEHNLNFLSMSLRSFIGII